MAYTRVIDLDKCPVEDADLDDVISSVSVVWRPDSNNVQGGYYANRRITLKRLVELVADEIERRKL